MIGSAGVIQKVLVIFIKETPFPISFAFLLFVNHSYGN
jgi:hypothetical protein